MSPECEEFIRGVLKKQWQSTFTHLNALNNYELLRGLAAIDRNDLADLWAQKASFASLVDMARIEFAHATVTTRKVPKAPARNSEKEGNDLHADASTFVGDAKGKTRLAFENDLTGMLPKVIGKPPAVSEAEYEAVAKKEGVEVEAIKAVAQVEGGQRAFSDDGRPILRFEQHLFKAATANEYDKTHPWLSMSYGTKDYRATHDIGQENEYSLLFNAMILRNAAGDRRKASSWESSSWGKFQQIGLYRPADAGTIDNFVAKMFLSEAEQLKVFIAYCRGRNLIRHLKSHDWVSFAAYNGNDQAVYGGKIGDAYDAIIAAEQAAKKKKSAPPPATRPKAGHP